MSLTLRCPRPEDVPVLGQLVHDAFAGFHDRHQIPRDFAAREVAVGLMQAWTAHPRIWGVVAEDADGRIVACNFLDERNSMPGVGPVCVDPSQQGGGLGRAVMQAVVDRGRQIGATSVRLVQEPLNCVSLSLYTSVGFDVKEPLALMRGNPAAVTGGSGGAGDAEGAGTADVRPMTEADLPACADLCRRVHGFDRTGELRDALKQFRPFVLLRGGRVAAYASAPTFWLMNHAVAETERDLRHLLLGAAAQSDGQPISFLVPIRHAGLFRWCLSQELRMVKPMTLMALGDYQEPRGAWVPSVEY
jgi:GNAT superfamily N-acetyltransferase